MNMNMMGPRGPMGPMGPQMGGMGMGFAPRMMMGPMRGGPRGPPMGGPPPHRNMGPNQGPPGNNYPPNRPPMGPQSLPPPPGPPQRPPPGMVNTWKKYCMLIEFVRSQMVSTFRFEFVRCKARDQEDLDLCLQEVRCILQ